MAEKFLIDSNSFMTPYRQYYAFDLVPTFWKDFFFTFSMGFSKMCTDGNPCRKERHMEDLEHGDFMEG